MSGDGERPRRSWREIDQMRDGARPQQERRPRGEKAEARARQATKEYLKELDRSVFAGGKANPESRKLAETLRTAHGTPDLADACRAYVEAAGMPDDPALLSLFLDADDPALVVAALEALLAIEESGALEAGSGLRSQVRLLAGGFDDEVAEAAEALLERL